MKPRNIRLIFVRELCDQLRDRRTLFTILVLPLVLYPLLGMGLLQTTQFIRPTVARVLVVGSESLPTPAADRQGVVESLGTVAGRQPIEVVLLPRQAVLASPKNDDSVAAPLDTSNDASGQPADHGVSDDESGRGDSVDIERWLAGLRRDESADVLVYIPARLSHWLTAEPESNTPAAETTAPRILLVYDAASDRSRAAALQVREGLDQWREAWFGAGNQHSSPARFKQPFCVEPIDVAAQTARRLAVWSTIVPFLLLFWALTGAFYPAIDVCAGEKERGTLETLLASPARRSEIVVGKWLTVMVFSVTTSLLNLASMSATTILVGSQLARVAGSSMGLEIGLPPLAVFLWVMAALVPMSALFSALAMALAALARSSKEGQYYLIPLLMLMLPLMMIASLPSARLDLGTSLIPVSGMMLLQRTLIEGDLARAARFAGPVAAVTLICCWLAARWAVWQFKSETVLFRSGERFGVGLWFRQLIRDRGPLPTVGEALLCGVLILVMRFCVGMSGGLDLSWSSFAKQAVIIQVATVAVPTILMTLFLTRMPRRTLRLAGARVGVVAAAILAAIALHPAMTLLSGVVMEVYPASAELTQANQVLAALIDAAPGIVAVVLVFALVPAICEELAFRGFILSGLQSLRGTWTPILLTSLLFGLTHGILQQSLIALVTGTLLGVIAVRTGSLWPCIAFHATHNALSILVPRLRFDVPGSPLAPFFQHVVDTSGVVQVSYQPLGGALLTLLGGLVMVWLWKSGSRDKSASGTALPVPAEA